MTQDKEKIIERIKKLIALSEDLSTTEGERAACRRRAEKLMLQFSLDQSQLEGADLEIISLEFKLEKKVFGLGIQTLCSILGRIGPNFGCYSYFLTRQEKVYIMGFKVNCEIVNYTATVLINQGVRDCAVLWKVNPSANTKLAFWKGFIQGLEERFKSKSAAEETGIALYDKVRAEFLANTQFVKNLQLGSSGEALKAGFKSAQEASVNGGLKSSEGAVKQIG